MWFSSANYTFQEPLSNFEVDKLWATLTLLRGGDNSCSFTVSYTTVEGSARPGQNYVSVNGTVRFESGEDTKNITIALLASEASSEVRFSVVLSAHVTAPPAAAAATSTSDCQLVTSEPDETTVVIANTPRTGVLFPDRPVVVSLLPDGSYATGSPLYYNTPAICIDVSIIDMHTYETFYCCAM